MSRFSSLRQQRPEISRKYKNRNGSDDKSSISILTGYRKMIDRRASKPNKNLQNLDERENIVSARSYSMFREFNDVREALSNLKIENSERDSLLSEFDSSVDLAARTLEVIEKARLDLLGVFTEGSASYRQKVLEDSREEIQKSEERHSQAISFYSELITKLREQSMTDPLVSLMNIRGFKERVETYLDIAQKDNIYMFGLIDIDNFKQYNDDLGHFVGDNILKVISEIINKNIRSRTDKESENGTESEKDPMAKARLGGDEFSYFMPNLGVRRQDINPEQDKELNRLITSINERFCSSLRQYDWRTVHPDLSSVQVSIGVVVIIFNSNGHRYKGIYDDIYQKADAMMYKSKRKSESSKISVDWLYV